MHKQATKLKNFRLKYFNHDHDIKTVYKNRKWHAAIKYARDDIKMSYTSFSTAACCCCSLLFIDHSFPTLHIVGCRFLVQVSGFRAVLKCTKSSHSPTIVPKLHEQKRLLIVLAVWYMTQATRSLISNQECIRTRTEFPTSTKNRHCAG